MFRYCDFYVCDIVKIFTIDYLHRLYANKLFYLN